MKGKKNKLYNMAFPIWLLWLIPITWLIILPVNFFIDLLVVVLMMKYLKIKNIKSFVKPTILRIWIFGFIADMIGTVLMIIPCLIQLDYNSKIGMWWYHNLANAIMYNPFESPYAFIWVTVSLITTAYCIYYFNFKFCLKKVDLSLIQKNKIALSLAVFTAPYAFYFPTAMFF